MVPNFRLRVHSGQRDPERFPLGDDDALGDSVFGLLHKALERGLPRPALLTVEDGRVRHFDVVPLLEAGPPHRDRMMAAIAGGQDGVEVAIFAGVLNLTFAGRRDRVRAAVVFAEWPDNRWWTAWQALGPDRSLIGDAPIVRRAVEGWPRPGGMGGWFALARRTGIRLHLRPPGGQEGLDLVH